jgi:hypothetical protein
VPLSANRVSAGIVFPGIKSGARVHDRTSQSHSSSLDADSDSGAKGCVQQGTGSPAAFSQLTCTPSWARARGVRSGRIRKRFHIVSFSLVSSEKYNEWIEENHQSVSVTPTTLL